MKLNILAFTDEKSYTNGDSRLVKVGSHKIDHFFPFRCHCQGGNNDISLLKEYRNTCEIQLDYLLIVLKNKFLYVINSNLEFTF